jgi:hypothetical protein
VVRGTASAGFAVRQIASRMTRMTGPIIADCASAFVWIDQDILRVFPVNFFARCEEVASS